MVESASSGQSSDRQWSPFGSAIKYVLLVIALTSWFSLPPLRLLFPDRFEWLVDVYFACLLALFFLFLGALLFRRWKEVAILLGIWAVVLMPIYGPRELPRWVYVEAFRRHASPIEEYLSRCKLVEFVENGAKQKVGVCERLGLPGGGLTVVYDTTGQLMLPASQRAPAWKQAMGRFSPGKFFIQSAGHARHLFGNFYEVAVPFEAEDGAADEY
jgi:hypothetical protein